MNLRFYIANLAKALSNYALIFSFSHSLNKELLGEYFYFFAIASLLSILYGLGAGSLVSRTSYHKIKCKIFFNLAVFATLVFWGLSYNLILKTYLFHALLLYSLAKTLELILEAYLIAIGDINKCERLFVLIALVNITFSVLCYFKLINISSVDDIFYWLGICCLIVFMYFYQEHALNIFRFKIRKYIYHLRLKYVLFSLLCAFFNSLLMNGDRIVLGNLMSKESLAAYSLLYTFVFSTHRFFTLPFSQLSARQYFKDKDEEKFKQLITKGAGYLTLILLINYFLINRFYWLLGLESSYFLESLGLSIAVLLAYLYVNNLTKCKLAYDSWFMLKSQVISALIVILGNILLIKYYKFGWEASVIMTIVGYFFGFIFTKRYSFLKLSIVEKI